MKRRKRRLNPIYWTFQFLSGLVAIGSLFWIPYLVEKIVNCKEDFTMEKYTIDELLDVLQWARDRAAYFRACNKPIPGALYAADCKAERDAEAELYRRGYYTA